MGITSVKILVTLFVILVTADTAWMINSKAQSGQPLIENLNLLSDCFPSKPSQVGLFSPEKITSTGPLITTLAWKPPTNWGKGCPDKRGYRLQIDENEDFSSPSIDREISSEETTYIVPANLLSFDKTYFWRLRAENNKKSGDYSAITLRFSTLTASTDSGQYSAPTATPNGFNVTQTKTPTRSPSSSYPEFSVKVNPTLISVSPGNYVTGRADTQGLSASSREVTFSAEGLPTETTLKFAPPSCTPTCSPLMTISTSQDTPSGLYSVTISATNGKVKHSNIFTLKINNDPLSVSLFSSVNLAYAPLTVSLTAGVGENKGSVTYKVDCTNDGTFEYTRSSEAGYLTISDACAYTQSGSYTARVRVERKSASATAETQIIVYDRNSPQPSPPPPGLTLSVSLNADPSSGPAPLNGVNFQFNASGTATGSINYSLDCTNDGRVEASGTVSGNTGTILTPCSYSTAGNYSARISIARSNLTAENLTSILVVPQPQPTATPTPTTRPTPTATPTATPTLTPTPVPTATPVSASLDSPMTKNVQLLIFNPLLESHGNLRLSQYLSWNDPDQEVSQIISDFKEVSGGLMNFQVAERILIDDYGVKTDGFNYTDDSYLNCWNDHSTCHSPDMVDYNKILKTYQSCEKRNSSQIDEVWFYGAPWFGYWEATDTGPGAVGPNGPVIYGSSCEKLLPIMGFSYHVGVDMALEDFGHRMEGYLRYAYAGGLWIHNFDNNWNKFTVRDIDYPGQSYCGDIHTPPNGQSGYDWGNTRTVKSACDDWYLFPNLPASPNYKDVTCNTWGCPAAGYNFKKWWFKHIPGRSGYTGGKANNWWRYFAEYGTTPH